MDKTGLKSSDKGWLKKYQWAVNKVIQLLGKEDDVYAEYGEIAEAWNESEPPDEVKRKWVLIVRTLLSLQCLPTYRIAMKKYGQTIDSFLKKMDQ